MAPTRPPPKVQPWSTVPLQVIVNKRARDDRRADRVAREARNRRVTRLDDSGRLIHTRTSGVSAQQQNWTRHVQHLIHVAWAKLNNNGQLLPPDIAPPMGLFEYHDEEMRDELRDDLQDRQRKHLNAFIQEFVQIAAVRNQRNANRRRDTSIAISISIPYLAKIYATGKRHACACSNKRTRNVLGIDMKELVSLSVLVCRCPDWTGQLIEQGFFPTVPNAYTAISLDLLEQFNSIATSGSLSKQGFAKGMEEFHRRKLGREVYKTVEVYRNCIPFWLRTRMRRDEVVNNKLNDFLERRDHERAAEKRLDTMPDAENVGTAVVSNPFRFGTTRLPNLCPCCFHRFPKDKGTKAIMAIDGNFAQFRWGHVGKGNTDMYDDMFFLHPPPDTVKFLNKLQIPTDPTVCDHNFKASSNFKPRTMEMFDETGLLLVVCRHDMPLRFLNIYAGERLGWIQFTVEKMIEILDREVCDGIEVLLLYDVACRLEPFLKKRDPDGHLMKRLSIAVNKFHGYAHEYRCHELWGAQQRLGLGESDGEGTERVWAKLRVLVTAGRSSTRANRMLFINNFTLSLSFRKRMTLAPLLRLRMQKYSNKLLSQTRQLKALLGTTVTAPDKSPVLITEDLLRAEHLKQRAYFGAPPVRADTPNVAVLELVLKEQALKHKANVAEANRKTMIDSGVPAEVADARFRDELSRIPIDRLYATTAELKRKLDELGQDRAEWDEGSERYVLAMRKRVPEWKIYRTLINAELAEAKLAEALKNPELKNEHLFVLQRDVANLKEDAQRQMNLLGQDSEAWKRKRLDKDGKDIGPGEHWARQHHLNAVSKVSVICQRLYKSAASRSLEFFQLKAQVTGQKERDRVMRDMLSRYPAMESDIKAFNSEIKELPAKYRPSELTMAAFAEPDAEETCGVDGKPKPNPRDALFYLELCKSTLLGSAAKGRDELWAFSSDVRVGINVQQRRDRCQEELELLKVEWIRLVHYTRTILVTMWEFVSYPTKTEEPFVRIVQSRLWEELQGARNILLTASKSASPLPTGDLAGVAEAIEHHLDVFYREGAPLNNLTRRAPQKSRRKALSDDECPNFLFRDGFIALPTETDTRRPKINTPDANVDLRQFASLLDDVCDFDDVQDDGEDEIKGEGECDEDEQVSPSGVESAFIGLGAELVYNNAESLLGTKEPSEAFLDALPAIVEEAVMEDPTLSSL